MISDNPHVRHVATLGTALSLVITAVGIWWYILDERERSMAQIDALSAIRAEQVEIRRELALQTLALQDIRGEQNEIASRQRWLASEVNRAVGDSAVHLGVILERTDEAR